MKPKRMRVATSRLLPNGQKKWVTLGVAFDIGKQINVLIDSLPVWPDWDGSLAIFPSDEDPSE